MGGERWLWLWLAVLLGAERPGAAQGRRLICWQAMLRCQGEGECSYAYAQYAEACAPVLQPGEAPRRRCPSHCIAALIQLNQTRWGPALEDCDCAQDEGCWATKRAIEPCLPRTGGGGGGGAVMGCTEARRRCDWDSRCSAALGRYMSHCGKLFNGLRCTPECRGVIEEMLAVPKAVPLNHCVCDGLERPICESVKENMARLCFGAEAGGAGAGGSGGPDWAPEDDYVEEEEEEEPGQRGPDEPLAQPGLPVQTGGAARPPAPPAAAWTLLASILLLR